MEDFDGQIGIDLGTTYSCVGVWVDDHVEIIPNEKGKKTTPSWVAFTDTEILVGEDAKEQSNLNPCNTCFDVKRILGRKFNDEGVDEDIDHFPFEVVPDRNDLPLIKVAYKGEEKTFKPEQISALVLGKMRDVAEAYLGKRVKKAVITVPAYFNDSQRTATKNAATIAGLECDKIINEPTAACMCYGLDKKSDNSKVLIFDLGGGTFDVSILNLYGGIFEVLSTSGDTHLGGEDFDQIIVQNVVAEFSKKQGVSPTDIRKSVAPKKWKQLKLSAERAKQTISTAQQATIEVDSFYNGEDLSYKLTRTKFEIWCNELFQKCLEPVKNALDSAGLKPTDIEELVLIGGSTRIPKIQSMLSEYFGGKTLNKSVNPDEAVAYGAAVQGAILSKTDKSGKTDELLLLDVTPLSLGIESKGGVMSTIIPRNTQIPVKKSKVYSTVEDRQTTVTVKVFEGERKFTADNHKIGDFELTDIPKQARGVPKIEVTFSIDGNGILTVTAIDKESGSSNTVKITDTSRLSQEDINRMVDEAEEFRAEDEMRKSALQARQQFEKELLFVQQSINDRVLTTTDEGASLVTEEEVSWMNQFILNNLTWLEENEVLSLEQIESAKRLFQTNSKGIMGKVYARKKQIDMKTKYMDEQEQNETRELSNDELIALMNSRIGC
jgi:L1 cell adhesion molecule like protein